MRRKPLTILLVVLLMLSMTACGATPPAPSDSASASASTEATPAASSEVAASETPVEVTNYTFLMDWNGGGGAFPDGWDKSEMMMELTKKTGVSFTVETITSSEREKLATIFASGSIPDVTNGPHWSTDPGGEGELIKNAGAEGLLLPLKNIITKYPNIQRLYDVGVISENYLKKDINNPAYNGEIYVIPLQTGRTKEDVRNWAYNLFVRKDILASLNITPESVNSSDAIYDLAKKIKAGDFKDINGKPVIVGGTWHNGWDYSVFLRGFNSGGVTGWVKQDGKLVNEIYTQNQIDKILFMRKLVAEGLFDQECFTQTDTMGKEKQITGRVAMFGCHYPHEYGFFKDTLYKTNPEMEFVPVGPILDQQGGVPSQVERLGRNGTPVLFFNKDVKEVDKLMAFIDYVNSDEGVKFAYFGLEKYYTMNGTVPVLTEEEKAARSADPTLQNKEGFGLMPQFLGADPTLGWGWQPEYVAEGYVNARKINPLKFIDYKTADDVVDAWPGKKAYDEEMSTTNWGDELKKAFLSQSDAEAIAIVEAQRAKMKKAGYDEMEKFLNDEFAKDPKILN